MTARLMHATTALAAAAITSISVAETTIVSPGQSIQAAIDAAAAGDVILVQPGTYAERIDFLGKAIEVRSAAGAHATTIDATDLGGSAVLFENWESATSILDGFRITGGTGTSIAGVTMGGGIYIDLAGPVIRNCIIEQNSAGAGGGIAVRTGWAVIANCDIRNNEATNNGTGYGGGGIFASYAPMIVNCTITGNVVSAGHGGGIALSGGDATVANCLITENQAYYGGGVRVAGTNAAITNCTFWGNTATSAGGAILGMYADTATTVTNCILSDNFAGYDTETYAMSSARFYIAHSSIRGAQPNVSTGVIDDPMPFVNPTASDFRLRADSLAVNAGANDKLPSDVADLDGDGDTDEPLPIEHILYGEGDDHARIVADVVDMGAFEVQTLVEEPACPADLNGDALVNVFDLMELLSQWGACASPCSGDTDSNGAVDVFDLITVLDAWGVCNS